MINLPIVSRSEGCTHGVSKVIPLSAGVWLFAAVSDVNTVTTVMRCCVMDFRFVLNEALECCVFRSNWQLKRWPTRSAMRWLVRHKNVTVNLSSRREMGECREQYLYQRIPACSCLTPSLLHHPHQTAQTFILWPNGELWWIEHRPWSDLTAHECGMTGWRLVCGPGVA